MEIIKKYTIGISSKKDTLTIRELIFNVRPHIKFVHKRREFLQSKTELKTFKIENIPYLIKPIIKTKSWLGNGMQSDDINCYSEWEEEVKVYDKELLKEFTKKCFLELGIDYDNLKVKDNE